MNNLEYQLQKALEECEHLKEENQQLKKILKQHNIPILIEGKKSNQERVFSKEEKIRDRIKLYRDLFRGREDVYAVRWEYSGEKGYSPARDRKSKDLLPLTDQVIYDHLSGRKTIGIYPILRDDTCWFLAVDFDKNNWKEDASAFIDVCKAFDVPAYMERSRSGNGCHVWLFFKNAIPAKLARKLGNVLLTRTLEKRYQVGISSYDRLFPNQDILPKGGYGNLIALPLQKHPRKKENSVFVDRNFNTYHDQWLYLSEIRKIGKHEVEQMVKENYRNEASAPVIKEAVSSEKMPEKLTIICENGIYIPIKGIPSDFVNKMIRLATFNNPEFYKAQSKRLSTYKIPRIIDCTKVLQDYLVLPRGCMDSLKKLIKEYAIEPIIKDKTNRGTAIEANFHGQLTSQQEEAVQSLLKFENGILSATTGFGKTVAAASLITRRKVNTLIIVHRKQLMDQWKQRLSSFLNLDINKIGQIGGGKTQQKGL